MILSSNLLSDLNISGTDLLLNLFGVNSVEEEVTCLRMLVRK